MVLFRDVKPHAGTAGSHVEERVITGSDELSSGLRSPDLFHCTAANLNVLILMHQVQHKHHVSLPLQAHEMLS